PGDLKRTAEEGFGFRFAAALRSEEQIALQAVELRVPEVLPRLCRHSEPRLHKAERLGVLARGRVGLRQQPEGTGSSGPTPGAAGEREALHDFGHGVRVSPQGGPRRAVERTARAEPER